MHPAAHDGDLRVARVWLGGTVLLALIVRVVYLLLARPPFDSPYWALSDNLLQHGSLGFDGVKTTAFEPGYPIFLALARSFGADRVLVVQSWQCILAAAGAVFLFRLARTLTGRWQVGVVAALLFAGYPLLVRHSADGSDAALTTTLLVAFAAEFVAAASSWRAAGAGVLLGLAALTRAMVLPIVPVAALMQWNGRGWRQAAALGVAALITVSPYLIRNYRLNGSSFPTRSGVNLFISNNEYSPKILPEYAPDLLGPYAGSVFRRHTSLEPHDVSPALERDEDRVLTRAAFAEMQRRPLAVAGLKIRNVFYLFWPRLVPYHIITPETRIQLGPSGEFVVEGSPSRPLLHQVVYAISYLPILALAAMGIWLRRSELRRDGILWAIVATFVVVHAVYFPTTRYRVPIEFVLLFYAAVALDRRMLQP